MLPLSDIILLGLLPAALIAAAGWDLASYTIPNFIPVCLIAAFAVFAWQVGLPSGTIGAHVLAGVLGLVLGFALFAFGVAGGGDAKLFAAATLWLGLSDLLNYALAASVFGGILTIVLLTFRRIPVPAMFLEQAWIKRLHDPRSGVPYGVALAAGGCAVLPYADVFRAGLAG